MKLIKKISILAIVLGFGNALFAADVNTFSNEFKKMNQNVSDYLGSNLPFVNSLGLNDATGAKYGFPFFSIGATAGSSFLSNPAAKIAEGVSSSLNTDKTPVSMSTLPVPFNPTLYGRVGIPFVDLDLGIKVGIPVDYSVSSFSLKNSSFGAELRYSFLTQGLTPGVSVAAGFDYMSGELSYSDDGSYGDYTVDYKTTASWNLVNYNLTARVGYDILFLSLLGGLQLYLPTGDVTAKTIGTFNSGSNSLNSEVSGSTGGVKAKGIVGAFFRVPLARIGALYEIEMNSGAMAASFSAQLVF